MSTTTYPGGYEVARAYDGLSRERSIEGVVESVTFNAQNLPARTRFANGTSTVRTYDARLRLDTLETSGPTGTLQDYTYRFNRADHLVALEDARPAEALEATSAGRFEYDALYRLTAAYLDEGRATAEWLAYTYDTVDNLVEKTSDRRRESLMHLGELRYGQEGTGAGPHAVSSISDEAAGGAQTYTYDAAGNMITREGQLNTWDFMGRLSAVESQDGGQPVARFAYGATRDRVVKEDNGQRTHYLRPDVEVRDGIVTVYVTVNGERVAQVQRGDSAITTHSDGAPAGGDGQVNAADAWVVRANEAGVTGVPGVTSERSVDDTLRSAARGLLLAGDGAVEYWHGDHLGSVGLSTDEAGGVVQRLEHYPYGHPRAQSAHLPERSYTGQERDEVTGLSYHSARYLDTRLGRWAATDPLFATVVSRTERADEAVSTYGAMRGSPLVYVDPRGENAITTALAILGIGGGSAVVGDEMAGDSRVATFAGGAAGTGAAALASSAGMGAIASTGVGALAGLIIIAAVVAIEDPERIHDAFDLLSLDTHNGWPDWQAITAERGREGRHNLGAALALLEGREGRTINLLDESEMQRVLDQASRFSTQRYWVGSEHRWTSARDEHRKEYEVARATLLSRPEISDRTP